jgi:hypothetical protein
MVEVHAVVPVLMPVTTAVAGFIDAHEGLLLNHVPGADASLSVSVFPGQIGALPAIGAGSAATVIVNVAKHPPNGPICV